tara:strand:- start:17 stop:952 length:936 start_codon:yes stop_codon:yes gene_type:complete
MNYPIFFDSKNSINLFGLEQNFNFLSKLYSEKKLPKVLMFTGDQGVGKSTLINHFLLSIFDTSNYNKDSNSVISTSNFTNQFKNDIFENIIYINGSDFKSVKVDDIRNLKFKILQSTILTKDRFIILNDVELFNKNSLNALLKIIEEPTKNNYFFLINNKSKPLLETIKSRTLEIKIILKEDQRLRIINNLISAFGLKLTLDPEKSKLSPGNFIKFNYICSEYDISLNTDFIENLSLLLNLYKKHKDVLFINLIFFIADYFFNDLHKKNIIKKDKVFELKNYFFDNLNKFFLYNINQTSLLNTLSNKLNYE